MNTTRVLATGVTAFAAAATASLVVGAAGQAGAQPTPKLDPSNFTQPHANAYFPLTPGLVLKYRGHDDGERFRERVKVTHKTKVIEGVRATVVLDVVRRVDGTLAEKTHDWYADDNAGNVWYLGESTATYKENGDVESREGSWQAGRNGARAGLIMPADPRPTDAYRQEFWRGHAEDQAWVVQNRAHVETPRKAYDHVVRSYEWSRLEKGVISLKFYAPHIGIVVERDVAGGNEVFTLVKVIRP
jgi:hypothetical protein